MIRGHLVVFARLPRLGVKRRLAAGIGDVAAWRFYRAASGAVLGRLRDRRWTCRLALTPERGRPPPGWARGWTRLGQGRGDIGARMQRPVPRLPAGPVVIVGTDVPGLSRRHVEEAFAALAAGAEAVFGPAADGGFWLVGWRRRRPPWRPYRGVRWSSPHALADVLANLRGRRVALLETLEDVDDAAALRRAGGAVGGRNHSRR